MFQDPQMQLLYCSACGRAFCKEDRRRSIPRSRWATDLRRSQSRTISSGNSFAHRFRSSAVGRIPQHRCCTPGSNCHGNPASQTAGAPGRSGCNGDFAILSRYPGKKYEQKSKSGWTIAHHRLSGRHLPGCVPCCCGYLEVNRRVEAAFGPPSAALNRLQRLAFPPN